jgi:hypothetical protein
MHRPKQQALAFLLGAVLVGGVLGFSADRVMRRDDQSIASRRKALYDDLGLAASQRATLDSVFDDSNCQMEAAFRQVQPAMDSIKAARRAAMNAILTPEQRTRLEARRKDDDQRRDAERKRIKSPCHK